LETDLEAVPHDFPGLEMVLAIVAGGGDKRPLAWGSGVFVAPGVALTATHVIQDYWRELDEEGGWRDSKAATFPIQAIQYIPRLDRFVTWHVFLATHRDSSDVAVLQLTPEESQYPDGYDWRYPTLDLRPVSAGTRVQAFGFPTAEVVYDSDSKGWSLQHAAGGSVGEITNVFPDGRDKVKLPFPCFEMNIETRGGMSGGPVVNIEGNLCGIVTSGWSFQEPRPHVSYASMLGPAMTLPIAGTGNLGAEGEHLTLHELARRGRIFTTGLDR